MVGRLGRQGPDASPGHPLGGGTCLLCGRRRDVDVPHAWVHAAGEHRGCDGDGAHVPVARPPARPAHRPRARRGARGRGRPLCRMRHRGGSRRCGVRVHRGEAGDHPGRHLAVRAREDWPIGGAGAVSDRCAFFGGARACTSASFTPSCLLRNWTREWRRMFPNCSRRLQKPSARSRRSSQRLRGAGPARRRLSRPRRLRGVEYPPKDRKVCAPSWRNVHPAGS